MSLPEFVNFVQKSLTKSPKMFKCFSCQAVHFPCQSFVVDTVICFLVNQLVVDHLNEHFHLKVMRKMLLKQTVLWFISPSIYKVLMEKMRAKILCHYFLCKCLSCAWFYDCDYSCGAEKLVYLVYFFGIKIWFQCSIIFAGQHFRTFDVESVVVLCILPFWSFAGDSKNFQIWWLVC